MASMKQFSEPLCQYHEQCSGCSLWHLSLDEQLEYKKQKMRFLLGERGLDEHLKIEMQGPRNISYRDRVDVSFIAGKFGFYAKNSATKTLVDIHQCPILSPNLQIFFSEFRNYLQNYKEILQKDKLSFRLRVSPKQQWGLWIDASHETIKLLFDEKTFLIGLLEKKIHIEIGQKLKPLVLNADHELKLLKTTKAEAWFLTFSEEKESYSIYSEVGAFTQPGIATNELMMAEVHRIISSIEHLQGKFTKVIELFSGNGNFSLAFLSRGLKVLSYESFSGAEKNLEVAISHYPHFKERIDFLRINLYAKEISNAVDFSSEALLFVDPPRSGIGRVFDLLQETSESQRPIYFLYVSCEPKSLTEDIARLMTLGYEIQSLTGIDQFLFSEHSEWICLLKKSER